MWIGVSGKEGALHIPNPSKCSCDATRRDFDSPFADSHHPSQRLVRLVGPPVSVRGADHVPRGGHVPLRRVPQLVLVAHPQQQVALTIRQPDINIPMPVAVSVDLGAFLASAERFGVVPRRHDRAYYLALEHCAAVIQRRRKDLQLVVPVVGILLRGARSRG